MTAQDVTAQGITTPDRDGELPHTTLAERRVPVPRSISPEARRKLAELADMPRVSFPDARDAAGWRASVAAQIERELAALPPGSARSVAASYGVELTLGRVGRVPVHEATPPGWEPGDERVVLMLHGGGWIQGGGELAAVMTVLEAATLGLRVRGVDYRMAPDHPYPAPLDDCLAVYRAQLDQTEPGLIALTGTSAGANLAAATVLRARDEGLPTPGAVALWSPSVDLTRDGDTWHTLDGLDPVIGLHMGTLMDYYARGQDPRDPYLSPVFGDLSGFPPTLLGSGTRDGLLSDTVRFHRALRRAGADAHLHVHEAMTHSAFFGGAPEEAEVGAEVKAFLHGRLRPGKEADDA
ncbi:alpha/beta hydrolase [Streptomyces sp. NPDC093109]|uniref:alpha/beta hydrolase n=1 Tax=Streptomyces sp. NPDC093109 TaxID=3154977 RepID=UPI00344B1816